MTKKRNILTASLLALMVSTLLASCGKGNAGMGQPKGPPVVGVVTVSAQSVALDSELPGRTSPYTVAEIRPQVSGIIQKRLFIEGSDVKAGQPLYQIDSASYQANLLSAQAALAKSQANVGSLQLKADRYKQLVAINAVGRQDYDDVMAQYQAALADVSASKAALDNARINLHYTHVDSPVSGRISQSNVTPGALVTANQAEVLATVQQLDPIYVDVSRSSGELLALQDMLAGGVIKRAGADSARVKLILEDGSRYPLEGKLSFSGDTVDPSTGSITLRAVFPNPKHKLLPGMYVRARLEIGIKEQAIVVPQNVVSHNNKGQAVVMLLGPGNKVEPRVVETPRSVGNQWLVSAGLKPGDQLIVSGLQFIRPGVPVKPQPAKALEAGE